MSENHTNCHALMTHASHSLSEYFQTSIHFSKVIQLNESDRRNNILRLLIDNPTRDVPVSFILKNAALEKNGFRPRIISRLKAFIECDHSTNHYPKLLSASKLVLSYLKKQWPDVSDIDLFPVFKSDNNE